MLGAYGGYLGGAGAEKAAPERQQFCNKASKHRGVEGRKIILDGMVLLHKIQNSLRKVGFGYQSPVHKDCLANGTKEMRECGFCTMKMRP